MSSCVTWAIPNSERWVVCDFAHGLAVLSKHSLLMHTYPLLPLVLFRHVYHVCKQFQDQIENEHSICKVTSWGLCTLNYLFTKCVDVYASRMQPIVLRILVRSSRVVSCWEWMEWDAVHFVPQPDQHKSYLFMTEADFILSNAGLGLLERGVATLQCLWLSRHLCGSLHMNP